MNEPERLDDASYQEGLAAFNAGGTLRDIIEQVVKAEGPRDETKTFSGLVGFVDGLLAHLRRVDASPPRIVVDNGDGNVISVCSELENACERVAASRTSEVYLAMINSGQDTDLVALDAARRAVREALAARSKRETDREQR